MSSVETLNVLTRTRTGLQYRSMEMENPLTSASELTSLPAMSWMLFAKDLYDGRFEQICILSHLERMKSEAEELRQLHAASTTESEDTLSAKKKEREAWITVRHNVERHAMVFEHHVYKQPCCLYGCHFSRHCSKMHHLAESVYKDHDTSPPLTVCQAEDQRQSP
ncbi:hypothetical protein PC121_g23743 [Phytophthora cactorum]|nr:hypothetical protein PC120_g26123 [Phytophthora cactorum]KAG3039309.1 hypothetical protein PC121_g23743 [Phytophthora cactorum]KAG4036897.1 hypothetical protein PC123_g27533 [Phytophthora cactorum]